MPARSRKTVNHQAAMRQPAAARIARLLSHMGIEIRRVGVGLLTDKDVSWDAEAQTAMGGIHVAYKRWYFVARALVSKIPDVRFLPLRRLRQPPLDEAEGRIGCV